MKLKKITLTNFRCFQHLQVDFDPRLTVFTAANGHGKTTILEAVKFALGSFVRRFPLTPKPPAPSDDNIRTFLLTGRADEEFQELPYFLIESEAEVAAGDSLAWNVFVVNHRLSVSQKNDVRTGKVKMKAMSEYVDSLVNQRNGGEVNQLPVVAYFGTQRAVVKQKVQRRRGFRKELEYTDGYVGCLNADLDYKQILEWIEIFEKQEYDECKRRNDISFRCLENRTIQYALRQMLPELSNLRTKLSPYRLVVDACMNVDSPDGGEIVPCRVDEYLSDGYRCVLMLVLNLISRILKLNPHAYANPEEVLACPGIVLIDEVDLHLHPSWQQRVLPDLLHVFRNIQFIVTTHSPQVVSTVPNHCIRRITGGGIAFVNVNTKGALARQMLSEVFETGERPRRECLTEDIANYRKRLDDGTWDTEAGRKLWDRLLVTMQADPEFAALSVDKMMKQYERDGNCGNEKSPQE